LDLARRRRREMGRGRSRKIRILGRYVSLILHEKSEKKGLWIESELSSLTEAWDSLTRRGTSTILDRLRRGCPRRQRARSSMITWAMETGSFPFLSSPLCLHHPRRCVRSTELLGSRSTSNPRPTACTGTTTATHRSTSYVSFSSLLLRECPYQNTSNAVHPADELHHSRRDAARQISPPRRALEHGKRRFIRSHRGVSGVRACRDYRRRERDSGAGDAFPGRI
jgi:hypothetical protein